MHDLIFFDAVGKHVIKMSSGYKKCFLCSPFVKMSALDTILRNATPYANITLVTKIDLEAFAEGISDFLALKKIVSLGCSLFILQNLHAKYYRFDHKVFLGSANLTDKGLGWSESPNFEILMERKFGEQEQELEEKILELAVELNEQSLEKIGELVDQYKVNHNISQNSKNGDLVKQFEAILKNISGNEENIQLSETLAQRWIPESFVTIDQLYKQYLESKKDEALPIDLLNLGFKCGTLGRNAFVKQLQQRIRQTYIYKKICDLCNTSVDRPFVSFGLIRSKLAHVLSEDREQANEQVNLIYNWLSSYLPDEFFEPQPMTYSRLLGHQKREK